MRVAVVKVAKKEMSSSRMGIAKKEEEMRIRKKLRFKFAELVTWAAFWSLTSLFIF